MRDEGITSAESTAPHQPPDESFGFITIVGGGFVVIAIIGVIVAFFSLRGCEPPPGEQGEAAPRTAPFREPTFAAPRLQEKPGEELTRHRQWEHSMLNGYALVDRQRGIARIPIERAMDLYVEQRPKTREGGGPPPERR